MQRTKTIPAVIEKQISTTQATVQVIHLDWKDNAQLIIDPLEHFQIDLCLSARLHGMSVCYPDIWGEQRFEQVGELMLIPPGKKVIARCHFPEGKNLYTHSSTVMTLPSDSLSEFSNIATEWNTDRLITALDIDDQSIYSLMNRVSREVLNSSNTALLPSSEKLIDLIAQQLAIEIGRYFEGNDAVEFKGGLATWRLRLIDERVQQLSSPPSIDELAALCRISTRQLQRGYRTSRGTTIGRYIDRCRIDNAKRLLQRGETIAQVAARLGYGSQSSFTYAFRRATGNTPAQFNRLI